MSTLWLTESEDYVITYICQLNFMFFMPLARTPMQMRNMKQKLLLWSLTASFILLASHSHASKQDRQRPDLTIVYTNDVLGEIEPCG